jgi:hypothetical protein
MPVCGPSGGVGGSLFNDEPLLEAGTRVVRVEIRTGEFVDSVEITHLRPDETLLDLPHHGGFGGEEQTLDLNREEHITSLDGQYGNADTSFVNSIRIRTDQGRSLAGGGPGGDGAYTYEAPQGFEIVGFFGRAGQFVDAIGIVLRPI